MNDVELVVLADEFGKPSGTAVKSEVHTTDTPLHFAFSCYVRNNKGDLLITRRALSKKTWPGVWTNSACGHLMPGETPEQAVARRVPHEIGISQDKLVNIACVLPDFSYRAVDSRGIVEWEICPVFTAAVTDDALLPEAEEVDSLVWVEPSKLIHAVHSAPFAFSPWMVEQLQHEALRTALMTS
ncbi:isopentenyl-diphosphate Delta-isomerase [Corynebacterium diphtheriae]|uniref:isopentenyl-diphosphate Delta-isomerase n=1 Tax=Corynebacterium diphtheriae TaxID=1717 RepID=UPI000B4B123D|nr:isopentenyl-diphosphate Delta-isomerase [Corynebacterium diphtheriae]OWM44925.1 isopentenyl-diphosphate delta-isomerase [Corynebacterium diphtheriae]OWM50191.1 isopentenyl-diphosphate delta-isomerase [Corynebacterium diphtheriae]OWN47075.1 isopentenyl-diphosphate delta-isomerase [Corynebacterium diphtheriae bv. mitis]OWN65068.1 isopentenyl-diphosphate delta-isomerase [Corynebacterium diphtheriae bv. mitis]OWN81537.1 isopentenyl-diphosphate delta-isomerase [Corynebacterium diphtheriae bv. mi